jgi:hypothetical protein
MNILEITSHGNILISKILCQEHTGETTSLNALQQLMQKLTGLGFGNDKVLIQCLLSMCISSM